MRLDTEDYCSLKEFAALVGAYVYVVRHYIGDGRIKHRKIGRDIWVLKSETKRWPPKHLTMGRPRKDAKNGADTKVS